MPLNLGWNPITNPINPGLWGGGASQHPLAGITMTAHPAGWQPTPALAPRPYSPPTPPQGSTRAVRRSGTPGTGGGALNNTPITNPAGNIPAVPQVPGLDPNLQAVLDATIQAQTDREGYNTTQINSAIGMLNGPGGLMEQITSYYDPLIQEAAKVLPVNPFTDQLKMQLVNKAMDDITRGTQSYLQQSSRGLAARGLGTGGTNQNQQAGGIISQSLSNRVGAETGLNQAQLEFNTQATQARQQIINALAAQKGDLMSRVGLTAAGIQAGNVVDPTAMASMMGNMYGVQLSQENADKMYEFLRSIEPTMGDKIMQLLPLIGTAMFPGANNFMNALTGVTQTLFG